MNDNPPRSVYGYSLHHDAALTLCQEKFRACPFGCVKDGAPNCAWHVAQLDCEPARITEAKPLPPAWEGWEENFRDKDGVIRMDWIADAMA